MTDQPTFDTPRKDRPTRPPKASKTDRSALLVTPAQRLVWNFTSAPAKAVALVLVLALAGFGGVKTYGFAVEALTPEPAPTIDTTEFVELGEARERLRVVITDANTTLETEKDADSAALENLESSISQALLVLETDNVTNIQSAEQNVRDSALAATQSGDKVREERKAAEKVAAEKAKKKKAAKEKAAQEKAAKEKAAQEKSNQNSQQATKPSPQPTRTSKPSPQPTRTSTPTKTATSKPTKTAAPAPATYTKTLSVSCKGAAQVTFTASSQGTITLSAGGKTSKGNGSTSVTINGSDKTVTAKGTGVGSVYISWSATGACS